MIFFPGIMAVDLSDADIYKNCSGGNNLQDVGEAWLCCVREIREEEEDVKEDC